MFMTYTIPQLKYLDQWPCVTLKFNLNTIKDKNNNKTKVAVRSKLTKRKNMMYMNDYYYWKVVNYISKEEVKKKIKLGQNYYEFQSSSRNRKFIRCNICLNDLFLLYFFFRFCINSSDLRDDNTMSANYSYQRKRLKYHKCAHKQFKRFAVGNVGD